MTTTMTTVDNILKEVYEDRLVDQLQSEVITLMRIEKTSEGVDEDAVGGKYTKFALRTRRNHGVGARSELQALPTPRTQAYKAAQVNLKYLYGSILLTGQTMKLAETKRQSFASVLDREINGMRQTLKKDVNRQMYGSTEGRLATATAAGTTLTLVTTNGKYVEEGMFVDLYDVTDVLNDADVEVTSVVESSGTWTITFGTAVTATATGDYITRTGSKDQEKTGFENVIIGTGTGGGALYGVTDNVWTANYDNVNGALSEGAMISMVNKIRTRGGMPSVGFSTLGVQTAYFNLLSAQRRYTNTTEFAGGFKGLAFTVDGRDIPIVADFDCSQGTTTGGRLFFVEEDEYKLFQAGDWSWLDKGGSMWERHRDASGRYDAWVADLHKYCEIATHRRNAHGVLDNVTEVI